MKNTLEQIEYNIMAYTAGEYADNALSKEKEVYKDNYKYHMSNMWGLNEDSLDRCIQNSYVSKLKDYAKQVIIHASFLDFGSLYVLDKEERTVSFVYKEKVNNKENSIVITPVYNKGVKEYDSAHVNESRFQNLIESNKLVLSTDLEDLIVELDCFIEENAMVN